jgi:hypothetical protein
MSDYVPDPVERMEARADHFASRHVEGHCDQCGKAVAYELLCPSPIGDGPALCVECLGFDPFEGWGPSYPQPWDARRDGPQD